MRNMRSPAPSGANSGKAGDARAVRALLEEQWRRRLTEISDLTVHLHDLRAELGLASGGVAGDFDIEVIDAQLSAARRGLAEVEAALARLDDGSYGTCGDCGEPVAAARLEVMPEARLCTECQSRARR